MIKVGINDRWTVNIVIFQLIDLMVGQEQADKNDIILEVSAGVGGQEAMLFTGEMFDLYQAYSYWKGWTFDSIALDISEQGHCLVYSNTVSYVERQYSAIGH